MTINKWAEQRWETRWLQYPDAIPMARRTPAHHYELGHFRDRLHQNLRKAESSLAFQLRTEKIGFVAFLHTCRVPDIVSPTCQCDWRREDPKHAVVFCPNRGPNRLSSYEAAGTSQYEEIMATGKGLRAVTRWVMDKKLLSQLSLAKEQTDRIEGRNVDDHGGDLDSDEESGAERETEV